MKRHLYIALLAVLGAAVAAAAQAQAPASPPTAPAAWRSAFDGYQPFSEEKTVPWRQANDTVQGVGGWRAYAREAAQPASAAAPMTSASGPHGAHHKPGGAER
ncbi:MAG: hypothetical protein Q8R01_17325 [Ramlibacter sp.]|nr:hypothetical protein [Ramlibacter sp.]